MQLRPREVQGQPGVTHLVTTLLPHPPSFPLTLLGHCPGLCVPRNCNVRFLILPTAVMVSQGDVSGPSLLSLLSPRTSHLLALTILDTCPTPGSGGLQEVARPMWALQATSEDSGAKGKEPPGVEIWDCKQGQGRQPCLLNFNKCSWRDDKTGDSGEMMGSRVSEGGGGLGRFEQLVPWHPQQKQTAIPAAPTE